MPNCVTCKQPIRKGELKAMNGDWHVHAGDCVRATARRCARISWQAKGFWVAVDNQIRKEFGLGERK